MSTLTLSISNLDQLPHNVTARHQFDRTGGTIGSDKATWTINDRAAGVAPIHCEIRWIEDSFCVIDHCQHTYLNDSIVCLGARSARRLLEGDQLRIGALRLQVQSSCSDTRSLHDLFDPEQKALEQLIADAPAAPWQPSAQTSRMSPEICSAFEPDMGNDPLAALDAVTGQRHEDPLERLIAGEHP